MKLSEWAKQQGISYKTAWRWVNDGHMPSFERMATGTILVRETERPSGAMVVYARVSRQDQKSDLDRQVARLVQHANSLGWMVARTITAVGSGLNGRRPKLMKLLGDRDLTMIVVEHRDRLMRFGFEYFEAAPVATGMGRCGSGSLYRRATPPGSPKARLASGVV